MLQPQSIIESTTKIEQDGYDYHCRKISASTEGKTIDDGCRVPLIVHAPPLKGRGVCNDLVDFTDVLPTLCELAGLPHPKGPQPIDGLSLVDVLRDPNRRVRNHAYHAYPKRKLGRAIRTERYRLVEWLVPGQPLASAEYELYDYGAGSTEQKNIIREQPQIAKQLQAILAEYPQPVNGGRWK